MKRVLEILPEGIFFSQTKLLCEVSSEGFSIFFWDNVEKKIHGCFTFEFDLHEDKASQLFNLFKSESLLHKKYNSVLISYSTNESAFIPDEHYKPEVNRQVLNMLYGDLNEGPVLTDAIPDKKMYNIYRIQEGVHHVLINHFTAASVTHQYSLLAKQITTNNNDVLKAIFYNHKMVVVVKKGAELHLIRSFYFDRISDVRYHLSNIISQFNMPAAQLIIGGWVKESSDLYKEIQRDFTSIAFDAVPEGYQLADGFTKYPSHYFSHFFSLAL